MIQPFVLDFPRPSISKSKHMRYFAKENLRITHYLEDKLPGQGAGKAWNGVVLRPALEVVVLSGCAAAEWSAAKLSTRALAG